MLMFLRMTRQQASGDYIPKSFKICIPHQILFGWSNPE